MLRYVSVLVAVAMLFSSCDSDFQLTGEYQETPLVYGILDPNDNPSNGGGGHLFRIQKAFLGEESAFIMALSPDSSYFKYEDLKVELVEYSGSSQSNRWELDTIYISNKDSGDPNDGTIDFFGPVQRLYTIKPNNVNIRTDRDYEILLTKIGGAQDSVIASSRITMIGVNSFRWNAPSENNTLAQRMTLVNTSGEYVPYSIRFNTATLAKQYEVWMRFYYREVVNGVETLKNIEWRAATVELDGESEWTVQVLSENIFSRIGSEVEPLQGVTRKIGRADDDSDGHTQDIDIFIRMAGPELFDYIDINKPSNSGALTDKPVYTNITNGLGVFSSRSSVTFPRDLYLSTESYDELVGGQFTSGRGFVVDPN